MRMKAYILLAIIMFSGCESEVIYVDSNTGKPVNVGPKLDTFSGKVVCNEFGMAYYKQYVKGDDIYTPVLVPYYISDNETDKADSPFITCEDYKKLIEVK